MHGIPRLPAGQVPDTLKDQGKASKLNSLLSDVLRNHHERCYTKEALKQNAQLLEINPEVYTAWNYRKLAVQHLMDAEPDEAARKRLTEDELRLVERALRANIKSYGAWYHRKWIIGFGLSSLDHEFLLLQRLLKDDSRNFHGWNYRRFAVRANKVPPEKELKYATEKINENFSNYSAWHYRSTLLSELVNGGLSKETILKDEYELVNQAYFTEPDDQSAWFYNSWLLGQMKINSAACLVGTWPLDGSTVLATADKQSLSVQLTSQNSLDDEYSFYSKGLPIILSFSEAITGVVVKVSSKPELADLNDLHWRSLSICKGPSMTWVAEFPLHGHPDVEYSISLKILLPGVACQESEIKFSLQVSTGHVSREDYESLAERKGAFLWPAKISGDDPKEERRHKLEERTMLPPVDQEGETVPTGNPFSEETEKRPAMTAIGKVDWQQRVLEEQIQNLQELLELEQHCKWPKLTLARVFLAHSALTLNYGQFTDEVLDLLKELTQLDPAHSDFYESSISSIFIAKVLRNPKSMKRLWSASFSVDSDHVETAGWLRWNGLSLSKFDSVNRMLWVQRLDLSHNRLRTVDGLEAMQLLVALDVSYNLIPHVTSLATLRLNPRLRCLNISHNEIGSHPVDSSRYSFPSVLTNQVKRPCSKVDELLEDVKGDDQWEVQAIFGGMGLTILETSGNIAASNKSFREALVMALPSLQLLDGEQVGGPACSPPFLAPFCNLSLNN